MSESMYKVCKALYDTSIKLKADRSFQAWYENIGIGKDKVSELLKRYNLYIAFPFNFKYVTTSSHQAVKLLIAESLDSNILYDIVELEITKVNSIIQKETKKYINYKNFEKLKNNIYKVDLKQVIQTEKEIEILEQYIKSLKKSLIEGN